MAGILIIPADTLAKVGEGSERGAGRFEDTAMKRTGQRVVRSEIVVERRDHRSRSIETILTTFDARRLGEATEPSPEHCRWLEPKSKAHARLKLVKVSMNRGPRLAADACKELCAVDLKSAHRNELRQLRAKGVGVRVGQDLVQNTRIGGLRRAADRVEYGGVEVAGHAIVPLDERPLIIPTQSHVERQARRHPPVILKKDAIVALRDKAAIIAGKATAGWQTEQEGRETVSRRKIGIIGTSASPLIPEVVLAALVTVGTVGFLKYPEFAPVVQIHVPANLGEVGTPVIVGERRVTAGAATDTEAGAVDTREGQRAHLGSQGRTEPKVLRVEGTAMV